MSFSLQNLQASLLEGISYVPVTLKMTAVIFLISVLLALLTATVRFYKIPVISQILAAFVTMYLGVPVFLAINVYYLLYQTFYSKIVALFNLPLTIRDANFMVVAYFTLILSMTCWMSETFRGAYQSVETTQFEAGYAIGMTKLTTLRRIIFPQMVPVVMPQMLNWLTGTLKNMSMISVIGIYEVMNGALKPCSRTYSYVEGYVAAALIYWFLVAVIEKAGGFVEKSSAKFRRRVQ